MKALPRILTLVILASACGGSAGDTSGPPPPPPIYSIQGTVQDSVAAKPVTGASVTIGSSSATTDFLGAYQLSGINAGSFTLAVSATGFEAYSKTIVVSASTTHNVPLRRNKPYFKDFAGTSTSSTLTATFIDLQGAATLDFTNSAVAVSGPGYTNVMALGSAGRAAIDATSVRVSVNTGRSGITRALWTVRDVAGNYTQFECFIGGSCTEL